MPISVILRYSRKICWPIRTRVKQPRTCHCSFSTKSELCWCCICFFVLFNFVAFANIHRCCQKKKNQENQKTQTKQEYIKNTALWNESVLLPTVFLCSSVIHSHSCSTSFLSLRWTTLSHVSCSIWDLFKKQQQQKRRHRNGMFSIAKENMVASEGNWNEWQKKLQTIQWHSASYNKNTY